MATKRIRNSSEPLNPNPKRSKRFYDAEFGNVRTQKWKIRFNRDGVGRGCRFVIFDLVIKEVVMVKCRENFCSALEPMLRRVVHEEVESALMRHNSRSPMMKPTPSLKPALSLIFRPKLALPIYTGTKILAEDGISPLEILLADTSGNVSGLVPAAILPFPIKLEIVVLDGDFPPEGDVAWTSEDFNKNVAKERKGKRPLLVGDLCVTMTDGLAHLSGGVEFTDNSSWTRSRKFRLGARVVHLSNERGESVHIREAMTDPFVVKDHRGESYKKHYPPALGDEVWRLEKIRKDGKFHRNLYSYGINTVQDFLKLFTVDHIKLRSILGCGMSEKMWGATYKHASTCEMSNKLYISRGENYTLTLTPICEVVRAVVDGQLYPIRNLTNFQKGYMARLVKDAYANWSSLQEIDLVNETALLTQGDLADQYPNNHHQTITMTYQRNAIL